jgi:uncharacterized protein YaaR (DUF327 family)
MSNMRVQDLRTPNASGFVKRGSAVTGVTEGDVSAFRRTLTDMSAENHAERLKKMRDSIEEQAAKLSDRADVREYERYRKLIREFLDEIVSNGYTFSREDAYGARGRHRFYATVKVVNQKLDELGKEVLKEQADMIEVIHKIDDIRGLLLDLMM